MYDPRDGRFLQTDPVGYRFGSNLYTYCWNNPILYVDPSGLVGIGFSVTGSAEAGEGPGASTGAGESGGTMVIVGKGGAVVSGYHMASDPYVGGDPDTYAVGAFAGVGAGVTVTTASSAKEMAGSGKTRTVNVGVPPFGIGVQYTEHESGAKTVSVYYKGAGIGAAFTESETQTTVVSTETEAAINKDRKKERK